MYIKPSPFSFPSFREFWKLLSYLSGFRGRNNKNLHSDLFLETVRCTHIVKLRASNTDAFEMKSTPNAVTRTRTAYTGILKPDRPSAQELKIVK